jgi:predicted transcriptional regulator
MNRHEKLDLILKYMSQNLDAIPRRPDAIIKSAKLNIEDVESYRMFRMMLDDGYVYEHDENGVYGITYKGLLFLENGGYEFEHAKYKLQKNTTKVSNIVDIMVKPIGVLTALLVSVWYVIKLLEFFGIINSCIN